jgi:ABC-type sugar transport system permease subunit
MFIRKLLASQQTRRILSDYVFILPQLILYIGLTILPFFVALPILFTDRQSILDSTVNTVGFANFTKIFDDQNVHDTFWPALFRTLRFASLNYIMVFVFGLTLALIMYELGFKGGFFTVIYLPWMISGFALGFMAIMLFAQSTGTVNLLLIKLGIINKAIDIKNSSGTTIILPIFTGWQMAGFNMAIFLSGLLSIPSETIEAAIVDGASYWQRLTRIYFPQMIPSFIMVTIFCLIMSFGIFDPLVALGGTTTNQDAMFLSVVFIKYGFAMDKLALSMTMALETGIPLVIVAILLQRLQKRLQYY